MAFQSKEDTRRTSPDRVFQPRTKPDEISRNLGVSQPTESNQMDSLIASIVKEVQAKLLEKGVPLSSPPSPPQGQEWQQMIRQGVDRLGHCGETPFQPHLLKDHDNVASMIDHTLLTPEATSEEVRRVCEEAKRYQFATVCVNSSFIKQVAEELRGTSVKPIAVVGFPLGAAATATKAFEARQAIAEGALEIDMVINIGALKSLDYSHVLEDIQKVVEASHPLPVKVILETSKLTTEEKIIGCALSKAAGAAFVKTSTGFGGGGATAEDVELMRRVVGKEMGVKASGGIRTFEDAEKMVAAGASRIGASASVAIVTKQKTAPQSSETKKPFKGGY